ncbi:MAG: class I SAM-dependent methyltransferase [Pseudonocardiaceae bacterium]
MRDYELVNELSESARAWVDPSNVEQLAAWDGDAGAYWAARADRFDEGVAGYREQFLAAAAIDATETVLDVGCGSGQVTRDAARCAAAGSAFGVDLSSRMIELARQRADGEQVANVAFHQADAQVHPFLDHRFTIVISRHGAMFFRDAPTAFTNIARAMRPGGRLVLLTWQPFERNEWQIAFFKALAAGRDLLTPTLGGALLTSPGLTPRGVTGSPSPRTTRREQPRADR